MILALPWSTFGELVVFRVNDDWPIPIDMHPIHSIPDRDIYQAASDLYSYNNVVIHGQERGHH